jgi:hypothetical protein
MNQNDMPPTPLNAFSRPRVVLWIGTAFDGDPALLDDLQRLPLVGVFQEARDNRIELALRQRKPFNARYPVGLSTIEEVIAWDPETLPVFYLNARGGEQTVPLRDTYRRAAMLERFAVLAEQHRPSVIALGLSDERELRSLLEVATEYGAFAPVLAVGPAQSLLACLHGVRQAVAAPLSEPHIIDGAWVDLRAFLDKAGVALFVEESDQPFITVGKLRVPLNKIIGDAESRIDHSYRILTARALEVTPAERSMQDLFEAVMRLNEAQDARTADSDIKEWWAIAEGIPCERQGQQTAFSQVLAELRALEAPRDHRVTPRLSWVAAEPGSGTTVFLHTIAFLVAREGYPVLVAKQMAREAYARQVSDFLSSLHLEARQIALTRGEDYREKPVLLVLDVPHEGVESMEEITDKLVRIGGRNVLTVRAIRIPPGLPRPMRNQDRAEWLRAYPIRASAACNRAAS